MTSLTQPPNEGAAKVAVVLAGGQARRLGGGDKGELTLAGRRLIDHVLTRLTPQADLILIAGPNVYGTEHSAIADRDDGPRGPAAALWAMAHYLSDTAPSCPHFYTVPVDAPFLPVDLCERLAVGSGGAIARDDTGDHPTFARWRVDILRNQLKGFSEQGVALHDLAQRCAVERVYFPMEGAFTNINTPEDLRQAEVAYRKLER